MKNKLTKVFCVILVAVFMFNMCGCLLYGSYGAYFATWEELDAYIRANLNDDTEHYLGSALYVRMPNDERFKESAYMIYNTRGVYVGTDPNKRIMNLFSYTAFRVEIDGEDVFLFGLERGGQKEWNITLEKMKTEIDVSIDYLQPEDESIKYYNLDILGLRLLPKIKTYANKYKPNGFAKDWTGLSDEEVDEMFNTCKWFGHQSVSHKETSLSIYYPYYIWGVYDTRDVPQAEKDALALELMEILYNNYKLAGEMAE